MIIIYLIITGLYIFLFLISRKEPLPVMKEDSSEKIFFGRMAAYLYRKLGKSRVFHYGNVKENLYLLNPGTKGKRDKEEIIVKEFNIKRTGLALLLVFAGNLLAIFLSVTSLTENRVSDGRYLYRNASGEGSTETNLQAEIEKDGEKKRRDFTITVEEQRYGEAAVRELAENLKNILPEAILGENTSIEEVRSNLELMENIEGYPFQISWESSNYSLVYSDGSVTNEGIKELGEVVLLTAAFTYGGYKEEYMFRVHVFPPVYSKEERLMKKINELLFKNEAENRCQERMTLPDRVDGADITWRGKQEDSGAYILGLVCICAAAAYLLAEKDIKDRTDRRNRQMLLDYPKLVSRLTLYMGAGMTIRNAFKKVALDYRKDKLSGEKFRYVYEEMLLVCNELDSGISEQTAYEHFGKRCRLPQYTKLSSLLVQNLKKGSNSISDALRQEAKNAFEERKNLARKLGEEAGTKLLLPMMLMLGIVMILIIIPAYLSFAI